MKQMFFFGDRRRKIGNVTVGAATQATGAATVQLPSEAAHKEHTMK